MLFGSIGKFQFQTFIQSLWINLLSMILDPSHHVSISIYVGPLNPIIGWQYVSLLEILYESILKSLDEHVWIFVERGWNKSITNIDMLFKDELNACNSNSKGVHAIFMAVSPNKFKRISMCETCNTPPQ